MATLLSCATGNFTTSSTWALCDSTSELDSNNTQTTVSTGNTDSSAFTPGAITVDGVAIKLFSRASSPSGNLTVTLRNSTDGADVASVTVNVSDLPVNCDTANGYHNGWIFFRFGANQTLTAGKNYIVRLTTSVSSQVVVLSNSGNLSRQLRTTTTQAPASTDKLIITGQWTSAGASSAYTVTMDNTASTTFGTVSLLESLTISQNGTLTYGTSASTNYLLKIAGYVYIATGGTLNIGTSGTAIPSTSTAILDFVVTSNTDSGIRVCGGTLVTQGTTKTTVTTVTSTANSGQAVVNLAAVSGWATNDEFILTPTERSSTQYEKVTVQSIATLAVTCTGNLTNKHSGSGSASAPNAVRGHAGLLTHNVKIRGTSTSLRGFIYIAKLGTVTMRYTEMKWLGNSSNFGKHGITWDNTATMDVQYCSFWDSGYISPFVTAFTVAFTWSNNVMYLTNTSFIQLWDANASVAWTISDNLIVATSGNIGIVMAHMNGGTLTNNICSGNHQAGFRVVMSAFNATTRMGFTATVSGNEAYNNSSSGWQIDSCPPGLTISGGAYWRNGTDGILWNSSQNFNCVVDGVSLFGNGVCGMHFQVFTQGLIVRNCKFNGETSFSQSSGAYAGVSCVFTEVYFENCEFSQTTAHSTDDFGWNNTPLLRWTAVHCKVGATTVVKTMQGSGNFNIPYVGSFVRFQRYNQTAGDHRTFQVFCNTKTDTVIYKTASPSERVTPRESSQYLKAASSTRAKTVNTGGTVSVSVWVRKSSSGDAGGANYTGNQLRLIMRRNVAIGLSSDVVMATGSAAVGTWEQLSGTTSASSGDNGVLEFYVDGDGTAGWFNVDDWVIS